MVFGFPEMNLNESLRTCERKDTPMIDYGEKAVPHVTLKA